LVPADWVEAATARQTSNGSSPDSDWDQGYGYQFWRCRHGFYRGDGAFGQYCIVMPQTDTVVVITSGTRDMGRVMNLLWEHLLPELRAAALPADSVAHARLTSQLSDLTMPAPRGAAASPIAAQLAGRTFAFPANATGLETLSLAPGADGHTTLKVRLHGADQQIDCGYGHWVKGSLTMVPGQTEAMAAAGAWPTEDSYTADLCQYRTPFLLHVRLHFAGDEVQVETEQNVGWGPAKQPVVTGKAR
jgi:hypothetical protein